MIRVVAPSRLHFGLFRVPVAGQPVGERAFGGVGLMVDQPGVVVDVRPADSWQFEGMLASRAQVFAARFMLGVPEERRRPFQVLVERCPAEHTGLGVGTQLGLAVAKALAVAVWGSANGPAAALAARVGRGERSAIGVHGFDRGGLIVEGGKQPGQDVSPLVHHVTLPAEWRVVVFTPVADRWHGEQERAAFASASTGDAETLLRLAETAILPAAVSGDIDAFGEAVHEFNRRAGEPFAAAQGGDYASTEIAGLIADVRNCGVKGVGQSSWGPTVFAIAPDADTALALVLRFRNRVPAFVSRVSAAGHAVQEE